ncbi:hypothetical protein DI005_19205 [Prauserella sp. PE36]|uniref:ABC transporter permease n=1 Tax=Prauserella endophytica TaxID=1592324 RepID=A0ABY2S3Y6_9PSEU|nr:MULTISPECIES: ABC transporter permease [Prauserella]PXY23493.1 hypothetical protein BAY59_27905 [Prauserella coralliicola]RBM18336.1 hypothetical protein DI005_19205 [Prauserella sp. PE36]TKG70521.1 ABC transporter permease [Prauserella endophytica]
MNRGRVAWRWLLRRLGATVLTLLIVSVIVFAFTQALPGDPALVHAGADASPERVEQVREELGLDRPLPVQYLSYIGDVVTGDFGVSARDGRPVLDLIAERLPATLELAILSLLVAVLIAVPAGIFAAKGSGRLSGVLTSALTLTGLSVPAFWFAIMLIYVFAVQLQWFNAGGYVPLTVDWQANLALMALPVVATGFRRSAEIARFVRSAVLDVSTADYVRVAEAKGLTGRRIMRRHILPNSMIPVVTVTGLQMAEMLGGLVLTETVFGIPGIGRLIVDSIFARDFVVVQGCLLTAAVLVVVVNTLVDLLYTRLDPRITLEAAGV